MRPFTATPVLGLMTLEQARQAARMYSEMHRTEESRDVVAYLRAQQEAEAAQAKAEADALQRAAEELAGESKYTLRALGEWYASHLEKTGRRAGPGVRSIFKCHVNGTEWADKPARDFTSRQAAALLRRIVESGKGRTAGKVRSVLHTAFSLALKAELDPAIPEELTAFRITANPISATSALAKFNQPRERSLAPSEMGEVWRRLWQPMYEVPLPVRALRLALLLGGQRAVQLLRASVNDVNLETDTITLYDPKGRRQVPRAHVLPLTKLAREQVEALLERSRRVGSEKLFASRRRSMAADDPAAWTGTLGSDGLTILVGEMSRSMVKDKLSPQPFRFQDMRRTAETMLAGLGISKDLRAQIQSHGLSGVQSRHYDRYEYMKEKRQALEAWSAHLMSLAENKPAPSNVRTIERKAAA